MPEAAGSGDPFPIHPTSQGVPTMTDAIAVHSLADLVDYQEASIVSKALIKQPAGNVTLFAFDRGEELSEHTSPYDALVYVLDGVAEIIISGQPYLVRAGEMIIMPADEPHALTAVEPFKMLLVMIKS
jgi:quercetin dioxygenase-like cupin family protein